MRNTRAKFILMPGMDGTGLLFKPLIACLGDSVTTEVVAYPAAVPNTWAAYADYVAQSTNLTDAWLVAESFSGPVAIMLLEHHAPSIKGIIFAASFAVPPQPFLLKVARWLPLSLIFRLRPPEWILRWVLFESNTPLATLRLFHEAHRRVSPHTLAERIRMIGKIPLFEKKWPELRCLYLQADEDRLVGIESFDSIQRLFPACNKTPLCGPHLLLQSRPPEAAKAITDFVN